MRRSVVAIATAALLAACGTDPEVREPDPTPSGSASTEPAPSMPAQAREQSAEGAIAFASYWLRVSNHAAATGETNDLRAISATACEGCSSYAELYENIYKNGGRLEGGERSIEKASTQSLDGLRAFIEANVTVAAGSETATASEAPKETPADAVDLLFELQWNQNTWVMSELALKDSE